MDAYNPLNGQWTSRFKIILLPRYWLEKTSFELLSDRTLQNFVLFTLIRFWKLMPQVSTPQNAFFYHICTAFPCLLTGKNQGGKAESLLGSDFQGAQISWTSCTLWVIVKQILTSWVISRDFDISLYSPDRPCFLILKLMTRFNFYELRQAKFVYNIFDHTELQFFF